MIHGHGDDIGPYNGNIRANFSSNVWHGELNPGLQTHLQNSIAAITHYPEPAAETLQKAAAETYGVRPEQVLVTNGATEAIYLIAQAFSAGASSATILTPSFAEYEDACRIHGLAINRFPYAILLSDTFASDTVFNTSLVFICNPNNPTGSTLPVATLQQLLRNNPATFFVIDESYIEFTRATRSLLPELSAYPNLFILRSLTKSCCIPGLRLGFVIGDPDRIQFLRRVKMPWSVNRLAIEAGLYIFRNRQQFTLPLDRLLEATAGWQQQLKEATGWHIHPTDTHYFLVEIGTPGALSLASGTPSSAPGVPPFTATVLKNHLLQHHSLLIRDASNFQGLTPYHFRVACQSIEHNQLLTDALRQCSQTGI